MIDTITDKEFMREMFKCDDISCMEAQLAERERLFHIKLVGLLREFKGFGCDDLATHLIESGLFAAYLNESV